MQDRLDFAPVLFWSEFEAGFPLERAVRYQRAFVVTMCNENLELDSSIAKGMGHSQLCGCTVLHQRPKNGLAREIKLMVG